MATLSASVGASMTPKNDSEKTQFEDFVKNELAYHKAMADMYEHLLANSLLASENDGAAEMLRTLLVAGMHQLAGHVK